MVTVVWFFPEAANQNPFSEKTRRPDGSAKLVDSRLLAGFGLEDLDVAVLGPRCKEVAVRVEGSAL